MKKILILIAGLLLLSMNVFADDVSIDSSGNVKTGVSNSNAELEVTGASGEDGILGSTSGTDASGVYGINTTFGNYGILGYYNIGVYGYSADAWAGYFQGNVRVEGNLSLIGTISGNGIGDITGIAAGTGLSGGGTSGDVTLSVDTATIQKRVTGTCAAGSSIRTIDSDGTVVCETDDTASSVTDSDMVDSKHASDLLDKATYDTNADGKVNSAATADTAASATDSDKLDGQHASDIISAASDEVRTPISACGTTISTSGSYYVTGNLSATGHCISITANNVTIDLMGFTLTGDGAGYDYAINLYDVSNVEVRNGTITNFHTAIYAYRSSNANSVRVINIRAVGNTYSGLYLYTYNNLVKDCTVANNSSGNGIYADNGSIINNNTVYKNGQNGIYTQNASTVTNNTSFGNGQSGIDVGLGSTVDNNTTYDNAHHGISAFYYSAIINNTTYSNGYDGIHTGGNVTISKNTSSNNQKYGISAGIGSNVTGNTINYNNQSGSGSLGGLYAYDNVMVKDNLLNNNSKNNIYVYGTGNVIEENLMASSGNGIYFNSGGNFYANNRARGNTTNYANTTGNTDGGGNASF